MFLTIVFVLLFGIGSFTIYIMYFPCEDDSLELRRDRRRRKRETDVVLVILMFLAVMLSLIFLGGFLTLFIHWMWNHEKKK